jgi:hypothetical protein
MARTSKKARLKAHALKLVRAPSSTDAQSSYKGVRGQHDSYGNTVRKNDAVAYVRAPRNRKVLLSYVMGGKYKPKRTSARKGLVEYP